MSMASSLAARASTRSRSPRSSTSKMTDYLSELERLSVLARSAEQRGDVVEELRLWRQALDVAPPDSDEYAIINNRVQQLSRRVDEGELHGKPKASWLKKFGPLAPILYLLWKMKAIVF